MTQRRLPPPWSADKTEACFIVKDRNEQALAYVYFEGESGRRMAAGLLTPADCGEYRQAAGVGEAALIPTGARCCLWRPSLAGSLEWRSR